MGKRGMQTLSKEIRGGGQSTAQWGGGRESGPRQGGGGEKIARSLCVWLKHRRGVRGLSGEGYETIEDAGKKGGDLSVTDVGEPKPNKNRRKATGWKRQKRGLPSSIK